MAEMTEEDFVSLVRQSEALALRNMGSYKFRLALFALLGYLVIFSSIIILALLLGGLIGLAIFSTGLFILVVKSKLVFVLLIAVWTFLRAMWVRFDKPAGYEVTRKDFPELFSEIDALSARLETLKIHRVLLERSCNAAVVQHPRFGILGGQVNTLILGLELLLAQSPEQMRAILGHELGHLSGNHSRFSGWIYRIRESWYRLMAAYEAVDGVIPGMIRRFFHWYAPTFSAYSFALARNNEYEADRMAAELTSPETAARALTNLYARAPFVEREYWTRFFAQADNNREPPSKPYAGLAKFLRDTPIPESDMTESVNNAMAAETHYADTHPSLKDRLANIVPGPVSPERLETSAGQEWLGARYQQVLDDFDSTWLSENGEAWQQRYEFVRASKQLLNQHDQADIHVLDDDTLWKLALARYEFVSPISSLPLFMSYLERDPNAWGAAFYAGRILAEQKDLKAMEFLRLALKGPATFQEAANVGNSLIRELQGEHELELWRQEVRRLEELHYAARKERMSVSIDDTFESPEISDALVESLVQQLKVNKHVGAAWLAQKRVSIFPDQPVYVVAIKTRGFAIDYSMMLKKVSSQIDLQTEFFVVCLEGEFKKLGRKVKRAGRRLF